MGDERGRLVISVLEDVWGIFESLKGDIQADMSAAED